MKNLEIIKSKIIDSEELVRQLAVWKFLGNKVVFTNGCFDIIHLGHIDYLSKARDLGDRLIIGLNTDDSVKRIKGDSRPITDEKSRAMILASFKFVDAIVLFNEDTPYNLINEVKPNVLVKGSDYSTNEIVGGDIVENNGGEIITIDYLEGYSTTSILDKIKSNC